MIAPVIDTMLSDTPPATPGKSGGRCGHAITKAATLLVAGWLAMVVLALQPTAETPVVAAIFPPWWTAAQAFSAAAAAGAEIVRPGGLPSILIVHIRAEGGLARLRHAGAWFTADPIALGGCFGKADNDRQD